MSHYTAWQNRQSSEGPFMDDRFNFFAKTLALSGGMPRREAVRRVGAAFGTMMLGSLWTGCSSDSSMTSLTSKSSSSARSAMNNSACAHFCQSLPPGPLRGTCVSDAAHGAGLCVACAGDVTRLCGSNGTFTCCDPGVPCINGQCCTSGVICGGTCCPGLNWTCVNGQCCPPGQQCGSVCCAQGYFCCEGACWPVGGPAPAGCQPSPNV